ncbi:MAG: T9SS type A sorting domain-containing protein, partial [Flavobacteriales bacterium]
FKGDGIGATGCSLTTATATEATPSQFDNAIVWTSAGTTIEGTIAFTGSNFALTTNNVCSGTDITEETSDNSVDVYPNPANDMLTFMFSSQEAASNAVVEIFNSTGQLIKTMVIGAGSVYATVSVKNEQAGLYIARITTKSAIITRPVVISR